MPTPSIQTLRTDAQQVLNLDSISAVRSVVAATLANANAGTPLNPNLTTQQLWNEFYQIVTQPKSDIESIIANQLMKFLYAPPAPGGVGANGQVIFNDGGVLAGDAGLTYNKTTDALTISGDLTVDTSTLKVDSANDRVGVGITSPLTKFQISGGSGAVYQLLTDTTSGYHHAYIGKNGNNLVLGFSANNGSFTADEKVRITTDGNVGIGVTPSLWDSTFKAIQINNRGAYISATSNSFSTAPFVQVGNNGYYDTTNSRWEYVTANAAAQYVQAANSHLWYTAASGAADAEITDFATAKMTLDASGNLILLSSNTPATLTTNGQLTVNATSNTNLRFSYRGSDGVTRTANLTLA